MAITEQKIQELIALLQKRFPAWRSFSNPPDPSFHAEEIDYKQELSAKAKKLLAPESFKEVLTQGSEAPLEQYDLLVENIEKIGKASNLLHLAHPSTGDLGILYSTELDKPSFCQKFFDLLYGNETSEKRLARYLDYVEAHNLPSKWTFPTYYLFLCYPNEEFFIKPRYVKGFLDQLGEKDRFTTKPTAESYESIKACFQELKTSLANYHPRDMIDLHSFMWVVEREALNSSKISLENQTEADQTLKKTNLSEDNPIEIHPDCPFSLTTFELLAKLHAKPKKTVYQEHKQGFKSQVQEPFQKLFLSVPEQLPEPITDLLETNRRIFGQILKNDYGKGGANEYYWGAFYPKGSKRTQDAQLLLSIGYNSLSFGFDIGHHSSEQRSRFVKNCQTYYKDLVELLEPSINQTTFTFGNQDSITAVIDGTATTSKVYPFEEWLQNVSTSNVYVMAKLSKAEVLSSSKKSLLAVISQVYSQLFPLVLLATKDDPLPYILEYLEEAPGEESVSTNSSYSMTECSKDTFIRESLLQFWTAAIHRKKQAILYGPPGTGKTYLAHRLARHLLSEGDGFQEIVQFHPAYTYEDFIEGIRPRQGENGGLDYPVVPGQFINFCEEARKHQDTCVLIIDEINRANLAQVFGELMYLMEYRDHKVTLPSGRAFSIPNNVRILGTMNTADRSIALVDHALRRRFAFLRLHPNLPGLSQFHADTGFAVKGLIQVLTDVNQAIGDRQYQLGTSFFLQKSLADDLQSIWQMEIEPYLEEYFFDQPDKVKPFCWDAIQNQLKA